MADQMSGRARAWRALPGLLGSAPGWLRLIVGVGLVVLGALLVVRPLTSLGVLAVYTAVSCILWGAAELLRADTGSRRWIGLLWVGSGAAILVWFGGSFVLLPLALAVILILGGLASFGGLFRGAPAARVLAGVWAATQLAFGILALVWPEVTVIVVAVLFGARTLLYGTALVTREALELSAHGRRVLAWVGARRNVLRGVAAVALAGLAAAALWATGELRSGLPVLDPFYTLASDARPDAPGVLLRSGDWPGSPPEGGRVTRILYTTTDAHGASALASAIVIIPQEGEGPFPVVVWNHGTTGIARSCAPSLINNMFEIQGIPAIEQAIDAGWVVVASDYSGQGAEGDFPYLIGEGEGRSALDAVRAARQLEGLQLADEIAIWGHSQGGHAALWTAAIAESYAPEFTIVGTAALSPAASPFGLATRLQEAGISGVSAVAAAWVLVPYAQTYPEVRIEDYVAPAGRGLVREFAGRCAQSGDLLPSVLAALSLDNDQPLYASDFTAGALGDRLRQNETLGPFSAPLFIAWGSADEVISPELQHDYVAALCEAGPLFEFHEYEGFTHMSVLSEPSPLPAALVAWTQERFAGAEAPRIPCSG